MRFAYPHDAQWIRRLAISTGDYLLAAQSAALDGNVDGVRRSLAQVSTIRAKTRPSDLQPDAMYPEMLMLLMIVDTVSAMNRLDELIGAARSFAPAELTHAVGVASVIRCVILRALLAQQRGDRVTGRRWTEIVAALWSNSDADGTHDVQQLFGLMKS